MGNCDIRLPGEPGSRIHFGPALVTTLSTSIRGIRKPSRRWVIPVLMAVALSACGGSSRVETEEKPSTPAVSVTVEPVSTSTISSTDSSAATVTSLNSLAVTSPTSVPTSVVGGSRKTEPSASNSTTAPMAQQTPETTAKATVGNVPVAGVPVAGVPTRPTPTEVVIGCEFVPNANCHGAVLTRADLQYANLQGADFSGADLSGADLTGADLSDADFSGANLTGALLDYATLFGTNLTGARLVRASFEAIVWDDLTAFPAGFVPPY